ncbi:BspC domain-containing protein [Paraburkholderia caffeinitolerans]
MFRTRPVPKRLLSLAGRSVVASACFSLAAPAFADQLDQHNQLVSQFIETMHADPLVADCAAHGIFVASTSSAIDHVEFRQGSFESGHASVTPRNASFGERKQHVVVDTIVTVEAQGIRVSGGEPLDLRFRCGYVAGRLLAFSWNDPVSAASPHHRAVFGKRHLPGLPVAMAQN